MAFLSEIPGRIFLVAALLPLAMAIILFLAITVQRMRKAVPGKIAVVAGWLAVLTMAASATCSIIGTLWLLQDYDRYAGMNATLASRWTEQVDYLRVGSARVESSPSFAIPLGFAIDRLTALMMCMVTIIGTLIFLFSLGYMQEELKNVPDQAAHVERRGRFAQFFQYLLLFAFSMLFLLISDNLLQVFVTWELVGVCSFLLIGFYFERKSASTAANKAFIMNRVGDAGFLIGLAILFTQLGTFNFSELTKIFKIGNGGLSHTLWIAMGLGLFAGCVGKSAQFPLQTWLPDAMEGPTPVSALIHAATMVAAGVYLCARCLPFFAPEVLMVIAYTGAITLFISAAVACVQTDIKRMLAFSTCSQLGYMMLALGLGGWTAGLFHLLTHAFFKALLFLSAGSVICALHHEQDLLKMGGLRKKMPITAYTMLIGVAAIIGVPFFSGWYSKDMILAYAMDPSYREGLPIIAFLAFFTVSLTAYYMTRLWMLAFAGSAREPEVFLKAHESPFVMTLPLLILAALSLSVAWGWPIWDADASYLAKLIHDCEPISVTEHGADSRWHAHLIHASAETVALMCAIAGVAFAIFLERMGELAKPRRTPSDKIVVNILQNRFYFDALYDWLFKKPTIIFSRAIGAFDKKQNASIGAGSVSDDQTQNPRLRFGLGSDVTLDGAFTGVGTLVARAGRNLAPLQAGRLRGYGLLLGLTAAGGLAILWILIR